jgi:hypothetical protein
VVFANTKQKKYAIEIVRHPSVFITYARASPWSTAVGTATVGPFRGSRDSKQTAGAGGDPCGTRACTSGIPGCAPASTVNRSVAGSRLTPPGATGSARSAPRDARTRRVHADVTDPAARAVTVRSTCGWSAPSHVLGAAAVPGGCCWAIAPDTSELPVLPLVLLLVPVPVLVLVLVLLPLWRGSTVSGTDGAATAAAMSAALGALTKSRALATRR